MSKYPPINGIISFENEWCLSRGFRVAGNGYADMSFLHSVPLWSSQHGNSTISHRQLLSVPHSPRPMQETSLLNFPRISSVISMVPPNPSPIISLLIYSKGLLDSLFQPKIYSLSSSQNNPLKYKTHHVTTLPKTFQGLPLAFRIKSKCHPPPG